MAKRICSIEGCGRTVSVRGWCGMHYTRWKRHGDPLVAFASGPKPIAPAERFWHHVDKNGPLPGVGTLAAGKDRCWLWTASTVYGYGQFDTGEVTRPRSHRFAYELLVGPIPEGLHLDHLCRVHACCNPAHLEPVTPRENALRGEGFVARKAAQTHCIHGHEFTEANTRVSLTGRRTCRTCDRDRARAYRTGLRGQNDAIDAAVAAGRKL